MVALWMSGIEEFPALPMNLDVAQCHRYGID
jgi:hypothetical protein